jgi:hypothetical protein
MESLRTVNDPEWQAGCKGSHIQDIRLYGAPLDEAGSFKFSISVLSYRATPAPSAAHSSFGTDYKPVGDDAASSLLKSNCCGPQHARSPPSHPTTYPACARATLQPPVARARPSYFVSQSADARNKSPSGVKHSTAWCPPFSKKDPLKFGISCTTEVLCYVS